MVLSRRNVLNDDLAIGQARRRFTITRDSNLRPTRIVRVREVEKMIRGELWMQRNAHQSAFATRLDVRHDKQRLRAQFSILIDAYSSRPFSEKHSTVRRPHN